MDISIQPRTASTDPSHQPPRIPAPDENAHRDRVFVAELATLNTMLAKYLLHIIDADAGRKPQLPVADEVELAERLSAAAQDVCDRVRHRAQNTGDNTSQISVTAE